MAGNPEPLCTYLGALTALVLVSLPLLSADGGVCSLQTAAVLVLEIARILLKGCRLWEGRGLLTDKAPQELWLSEWGKGMCCSDGDPGVLGAWKSEVFSLLQFPSWMTLGKWPC